MLKRKEWQLFQGQDGLGSQSEEDSESEVEDDSESEQGTSEEREGTDSEGDQPDVLRLEDLSEDDFDNTEASADQAEAVALKTQWLAASKEDAASLPHGALRCLLCKGVLLLGPASLRQHIESKKHLGRLKRKAEDYEPICIATGQQSAVDLETHQERLQRTKEALSQPLGKKMKLQGKSNRGKIAGKLGRRERAELKVAGGVGKSAQRKLKLPVQQGPAAAKPTSKPYLSSLWSTPATIQKKKVPRDAGKHQQRKVVPKHQKRERQVAKPMNRAERRKLKRERVKNGKGA